MSGDDEPRAEGPDASTPADDGAGDDDASGVADRERGDRGNRSGDDDASGAADHPRRHPADETLRSETLPDSVRCPHCGEEESEQFATFGSAVSVSQYYCRSCRTVFEAFRWR